jgi:copper chaperone CopZ
VECEQDDAGEVDEGVVVEGVEGVEEVEVNFKKQTAKWILTKWICSS